MCPPLRKAQDELPHSGPRRLRESTASVFGHDIDDLPDGVYDVAADACERLQVVLCERRGGRQGSRGG